MGKMTLQGIPPPSGTQGCRLPLSFNKVNSAFGNGLQLLCSHPTGENQAQSLTGREAIKVGNLHAQEEKD